MLPESRIEPDLYNIPKLELTEGEVKQMGEDLLAFNSMFDECFVRSETRLHFQQYAMGRLGKLDRKTIEPIAANMEGGNIRAMQRAISKTSWDEARMVDIFRSMVEADLGDPEGALIFDESGFAKKGEDSAGVARQYCGSLGKVENCQVGVYCAYASRFGYTLVDRRLYVPEPWFSETYAERRGKCEFPEGLTFKTKPELAAEILREQWDKKALPFRYVLADSVYGMSPDFVEQVERCPGVIYLLGVRADLLVWPRRPEIAVESYSYRGENRKRTVLRHPHKRPQEVLRLAKETPDCFWYRRTVSEGTKGPITYEFCRKKVTVARDGLPWKTVWLLMKRSLGDDPRFWFYLCNAPDSSRLPIFVWLSGLRWAIEQSLEEAKSEVGLDQYEVRKYAGWNHHMTATMLVLFFLWHQKVRLGKKIVTHYGLSA